MRSRLLGLVGLVGLVGLLAIPGRAASQQPDVPRVPAELTRFVPASPAPSGFIADVPDVIPASAEGALNDRIRSAQAAGQGDIGVAILPSIEDRAPVDVAVAIYRSWRIGRVDSIGSGRRNLGALLLIVPKELAPNHRGECWISSGTGAEGTLTDAVSARICRDSIVPHLRKQDYAAAVAAGIAAIAARLGSELPAGDGGPGAPPRRRRAPLGYIFGGLLAAVGGIVGGATWYRRRPRRCPTCGQRMRRLSETEDDAGLGAGQQLEERLKSVDYDVWQCPAGHQLVLPYKAAFSRYRECPSCHVRAETTTRRVLSQPTYVSTGVAEDTHSCAACHAIRTERITLPRRTPPGAASGGGSGGSSGGGGSSFGGSGSTSGGGGGSSY